MIAKLGWRNLWRNRRRTWLTVGAMSTAAALVVLTLGIYDGMLWDMIDSATVMYHGHAKVTAVDYLDDRALVKSLDLDGVGAALAADPEVAGAAPRVRGFALLSYDTDRAHHTQPAELLGIDPERERNVTRLADNVLRGRFVAGTTGDTVVLGKGLAKRLGADVGSELAVMSQGADGSIGQALLRVVGIVGSGDPLRDAMLALVPLATAQRLFALEGRVHEWSVHLRRPLAAPQWAAAQDFGPDTEVVDWHRLVPTVAQFLDIWVAQQIIVAVIFYFAVILIAVNTMTMAFFERIREFAVMGALGMRRWPLSRMILLEGTLMSVLAAIIGGVVGAAASFTMYRYHIDLSAWMGDIRMLGTAMPPRLRSYPTTFNVLMPLVLLVALGVVVALLPAWRLMRMKPVDALREV